ncbi:MAG: rhomboid family intramembrane serine protease [Armatimonadetes bacterium]|nr:rhomboid family intramembrane serine protease [Armatimonadota bacterium]
MLLPYASDFVPKHRPYVTLMLMLIMCVLSLLVTENNRLHLAWAGSQLLYQYGITPNKFQPITLFTYTFFHDGYGHLLGNCFYLWVFGTGVEAAVGRLRYALLFLLGSMVGGLLQWLVCATMLNNESNAIVGASAGCAALVGLFAVRYYRSRLNFVGIPFRPHVVAVVGLFLAWEIGNALYFLLNGATANGIANWAHIGGFVFGLGVAYLLKLDTQGRSAYLAGDAERAMSASQPGTAIKRWELLLSREPNNTLAMKELAKAWSLLGDTEQASLWFLQAIQVNLQQGRREQAALACGEMFASGIRETEHKGKNLFLSAQQLFTLGSTLEDIEQFEQAAEVLRYVMTQFPNVPEAEPALVKVIQLYIERLNRHDEARVFLHLFHQRYPHSQWSGLVDVFRKKMDS